MACRLSRLIRMIRIVHGKSFPNVPYLCRLFQIKERTLFNDLKELKEELGVDIRFDRANGGYYLAGDASEISLTTLNQETSFLLLTALSVLECYGGQNLAQPLHDLFEDDLLLCLQNGHSSNPRDLIKFKQTKSTADKALFIELLKACMHRNPLSLSLEEAAAGNGSGTSSQHLLRVWPRYLKLESHRWHIGFAQGKLDAQIQHIPLENIRAILHTKAQEQ